MCIFLFVDNFLKVTDIQFPANHISTDSFRVEWTAPSGYEKYISDYTVSGSGSPHDTGNTTHAMVTGLTPGQKYTVTVTAKNKVTQADSDRTASVSQDQAASKWAQVFIMMLNFNMRLAIFWSCMK